MPIELECKIRVESHASLREKIRDAGARLRKRVLEVNHILDDTGGALRQRGCGLRVRTVTVLEGHARAAAVLTFKGPLQAGPMRRREETETLLDDGAAMLAILAGLGYVPHVIFEKRRETWELDGCLIELDELPRLGLFVEVEGPDESSISQCLARLGLATVPQTKETYAAMVAGLASKPPDCPVVLRFDA